MLSSGLSVCLSASPCLSSCVVVFSRQLAGARGGMRGQGTARTKPKRSSGSSNHNAAGSAALGCRALSGSRRSFVRPGRIEGMLSISSLVMAGILYRGLSLSLPSGARVAAAQYRTPRFARRTRLSCVDMSTLLSPPTAVDDVLENRVLGELACNVVQGKAEKVSQGDRDDTVGWFTDSRRPQFSRSGTSDLAAKVCEFAHGGVCTTAPLNAETRLRSSPNRQLQLEHS